MAGTVRDGSASIDPSLGWDLGGDFIGQPEGLGPPRGDWSNSGNFTGQDPFEFLAAGGTATAAGGGGAKPAPTVRNGTAELNRTSIALDWFEDVHIIPRVPIEFGNIITQKTNDYEIYNAYRETTLTVSAITNNVSPGVTTPGIAASDTIPPQSSRLDATSTGNNGGTGLGTLVELSLIAGQDGLPVFDNTIVFTFSNGDSVLLTVSGSRIVLIPFEYESPSTLIMEFGVELQEAISGKEQRIGFRKQPREIFPATYLLDGTDRQRMQALLMDWMANIFGFPVWEDVIKLTAAASAGATTFSVRGADAVDLRVGGLAVLYTDANVFDVITIDSKTATSVVSTDPTVNAYARGTFLIPLRTARLRSSGSGRRYLNELEAFALEFVATDNDTGAPTGDASSFSTYNGRILFDDCNVVTGTQMRESFNRRLYVLDSESGQFTTRSPWDRFKRTHTKGFVARSRAEILALKRLLREVDGPRIAFFIPTFFNDLTAADGLGSGTNTIDIESIGYVRFVQSRDPKNIAKVTFTDGISLVREITSAATVSTTVERLTVDTNWPADRTVDEIQSIQFYELVRFDTQRFAINFERIGLARMVAPVRAVFDDVP